jgi:membrane-bound metal-dependent hydrolase YbcI (DUF457 family)
LDIVAHGVLGAVLFSRTGLTGIICRRYGIIAERKKGFDWTIAIAAGVGMMPDFFSFGVYTFERFANNRFITGPPALKDMPSYVFQSYTITHSLITALVFVIISSILFKKIWPATLAWPLHVITDIPLHSLAYFPTPFLYPFSDWMFDGYPLVDHLLMATGYWVVIILLCVFIHLYHTDKQRLKLKRK